MFLEVIVALVVGVLTLWTYAFLKNYIKLKNIPAPTVWPIIGTALEFKDPEESMYIFPNLMKRLKSKTLRMHMGFRTVLVTADYTLIERVLGSPTLTHKTYFHFIPWLGHGLFTSSGDKWRKARKLITPTFHFKILEQFLDVFNSNGVILINKLKNEVGNTSVEVQTLMSRCTLDIICETAMGLSVNAQTEESSEYAKCIHDITYLVNARAFTPLYNIEWIYKRTKMHKDEQAILKVLHGHTDSVIKTRRLKLQEEADKKEVGGVAENEDDFGRKKKVPFLDMLLQSTIDGRPLNDKELRDEVSTFMFAGHDTTSVAMSFTLFAIANHPEVQKKAFDELYNIFGSDKERMCTTTDLNEMKYLEMVIKESLRMYPSAPLFSRTVSENLDYNGTVIPPGIPILFLPYSIHHDPDHFPDPEKFDPERFSPENYDGKKPFSFIPFSAGPRNCLGQKYAMMEMKCLLSMILRQFELKPASPVHKLELRSAIILKSLTGIKIQFAERKY